MIKREKKFRFPLTMFSTLVLIIILILLLKGTGKTEPLFDRKSTITYYAKTTVGQALDLDPKRYFSSETYDCSKFTFDLSQCDWKTPGIYRVPILYDGKKTNCVVQITVKSQDDEETQTVPDMNENTVITGTS